MVLHILRQTLAAHEALAELRVCEVARDIIVLASASLVLIG
jgi:hypothetical protein